MECADCFGGGDDAGVPCCAEFGGTFLDEGDHVGSVDVAVIHCFVTWELVKLKLDWVGCRGRVTDGDDVDTVPLCPGEDGV